MAETLGLPVYYPHMILEGWLDRSELLVQARRCMTEGCLLNPNRYLANSRGGKLSRGCAIILAGRETLWLGDGIEGDDTSMVILMI